MTNHQENSLQLHQLIINDPDLHGVADVVLGQLGHELLGGLLEHADGVNQMPEGHVVLLQKLENGSSFFAALLSPVLEPNSLRIYRVE